MIETRNPGTGYDTCAGNKAHRLKGKVNSMKKFKRIACLLMAGLMAAAAASCTPAQTSTSSGSGEPSSSAEESGEDASGGGEAETSDEVIELDYMTWNSEDTYIIPIVEAFNESQDRIHVNYKSETLNGDAYPSKVLTLLSSQENLDIVGVYNSDLFTRYVELEALAPLDDYISQNEIDMTIYGPGIESFKRGGVYYAMPYKKSMNFIVYNKNIFDERNEPYPEDLTWDEFMDLSHRMTYTLESGETIAGSVGDPYSWSREGLVTMLAQYGELVTDDELPHLETCVQRIYDMFYTNRGTLTYEETAAMQGPAIGQIFMGGKAAMNLVGDYFIPMLMNAEDLGFEWDIAAYPYDDKSGMEPGTVAGGGMSMASMTSFCEHPEAAFEFLKFLSGEEGAVILASLGTLHSYSSPAVEEAYLESFAGKNVDVLANAKVVTSYVDIPQEQNTDITNMTIEEVEKLLIGAQTVEDTCANWDARRKEILSQTGA